MFGVVRGKRFFRLAFVVRVGIEFISGFLYIVVRVVRYIFLGGVVC